MGRVQAPLFAVLVLVLVLNHEEVQADSPCARECPNICKDWGKLEFICYIMCVDHCMTDPTDAKSTKQQLQRRTPEMEAKMQDIEKQLTNSPANNVLQSRSKHLQMATEASPKYHPLHRKESHENQRQQRHPHKYQIRHR